MRRWGDLPPPPPLVSRGGGDYSQQELPGPPDGLPPPLPGARETPEVLPPVACSAVVVIHALVRDQACQRFCRRVEWTWRHAQALISVISGLIITAVGVRII